MIVRATVSASLACGTHKCLGRDGDLDPDAIYRVLMRHPARLRNILARGNGQGLEAHILVACT